MGTQERRERERQELRTKILDAARELFVSEGYEAVTMRKIAEKIEYSATAIYLHFADKDALVTELCRHDFRSFAAHFGRAAVSEDPVERLRARGARTSTSPRTPAALPPDVHGGATASRARGQAERGRPGAERVRVPARDGRGSDRERSVPTRISGSRARFANDLGRPSTAWSRSRSLQVQTTTGSTGVRCASGRNRPSTDLARHAQGPARVPRKGR